MNTTPNAKRILCFGDSYTWGYQPLTNHLRYPADVRWTGVLQKLLGAEYEVIEEGLNSRTLVNEDTRSGKEGRRGDLYLIPCLDTHDPLDLVIIMLGTNELKHKFENTAEQISRLLDEKFFTQVASRKSQFRDTTPELLVVAPPIIDENTKYGKERYIGGSEKAKQLAKELKELCKAKNYCFIDSNDFVKVGEDGVHFDDSSHQKLGEGIFEYLKKHVLN